MVLVLPEINEHIITIVNFLKKGEEEMFKRMNKEDLDYILKRIKNYNIDII